MSSTALHRPVRDPSLAPVTARQPHDIVDDLWRLQTDWSYYSIWKPSRAG